MDTNFGIFQPSHTNGFQSQSGNAYMNIKGKNYTLPYYFLLFTSPYDVNFRPFIATDWLMLDNYQLPSPPQFLNIPSHELTSTFNSLDKSQLALKVINAYKDTLINILGSSPITSPKSAKRVAMLSSFVKVLTSKIEYSLNQTNYELVNTNFCPTSPLYDYYRNHFDVYMDLWLKHVKSMPQTIYCWKHASSLIKDYDMLSEDTMKILPISRHVVDMALNKLDFDVVDFHNSLKSTTDKDELTLSFTEGRKSTNFCASHLAEILQEFATEDNVNALFEHRRRHREERKLHLESIQSMVNIATTKYTQAFTLLEQKKRELNKISSECLDALFPPKDPKDIAREIILNFEKLQPQ